MTSIISCSAAIVASPSIKTANASPAFSFQNKFAKNIPEMRKMRNSHHNIDELEGSNIKKLI